MMGHRLCVRGKVLGPEGPAGNLRRPYAFSQRNWTIISDPHPGRPWDYQAEAPGKPGQRTEGGRRRLDRAGRSWMPGAGLPPGNPAGPLR